MSTTFLPVQLGSKQVEMKFNFGIARHLKDTKTDPFTLKIDYENPVRIYDTLFNIVSAALLNNKIKCSEDEVHELMSDWNQGIITQVVNAFSSAFLDTSQEGSSDTQQAAHVA